MNYTIQKLPKSGVELKVEILWEEFEKFNEEAIINLGKNLKIEGFRPGHIPKEIIEQKIGKMAVLEEAAELAIKENYQKIIRQLSEEKNTVPISQPQVEIQKLAQGNPFEFKISVYILPEVSLPDYKKIAGGVGKKEITVTDKDVEDSLAWLQKSRAKFSLKNDASKKGDFVEIEYSSPQIEAGKIYKDGFILGEGRFFSGFEENLENMKDGEERGFSVQFPDDYSQKDLVGKKIGFLAKMKSVQKMELPEISDDFAKNLGNFADLAALKENIKEGLSLEKEKEEINRVRAEILEKITAASACEIPEILIDSEKNRILEELKDRVKKGLQISFEEYLSKVNKSEKDLLDSFLEQAQKRVKSSLVLKEIAKKENISSSEEEISAEINNFLKAYPDIKLAQGQFDLERLKEYTKEAVLNEKTFKLLESLVK